MTDLFLRGLDYSRAMKNVFIIMSLVIGSDVMAFQPVDINNASWEQVALLPGIGKKLAQKIVQFRRTRGLIKAAAVLRTLPGMTDAKLAAIKSLIVFGTPTRGVKLPPQPEKILKTLPRKPIPELSFLEEQVKKVHGLQKDVETSLSVRARLAPWLPKVTAAVDFGQVDTMTEKRIDHRSDTFLIRNGGDVGIGIRASFDFDKLIYNDDELSVATLALRRLEKREEIVTQLHRNYFRYVRLVELSQVPAEESALQQTAHEMLEVEALLNTLTGGAFSREQNTVRQ